MSINCLMVALLQIWLAVFATVVIVSLASIAIVYIRMNPLKDLDEETKQIRYRNAGELVMWVFGTITSQGN